MKTHALYNFRLWLLCGLALAFAAGRLTATTISGIAHLQNTSTQQISVNFYTQTVVDGAPMVAFMSSTTISAGATGYVEVEAPADSSLIVTIANGKKVGNSRVKTGSSADEDTLMTFPLPNVNGYEFTRVIYGPHQGSTPDFNKSIWEVGDATMTADLYREGVDKIVNADIGVADAVTAASSGGGGGGGGGTMGTNATGNNVDDVAKIQKQALGGSDTDTETISVGSTHVRVPKGVRAAAASAGDAAAAADITMFQGIAGGAAPTGLGYTVGSGSSSSLLDVQFPNAFGGATFHMNPFSNAGIAEVCAWFRQAVGWLALVVLGAWVWQQLETMAFRAASAPQAKGNTVAGTGGQATAFTSAVLITVALVVFFTALVAWGFGGISWSAFRDASGYNPMASLPSGILYMVDQLFPITTMITALVARLAWRFYAMPLFMGCMAVVRFVVV